MKEFVTEAVIENLEKVNEFVSEQLDISACPDKTREYILLAVEELFVNIAHYAYAPEKGSAAIQVNITDEQDCVDISFCDSGKPYNPLERTDPDIKAPASERPIGGLGIFMVKKSMDNIAYEYKDGQNILTIKKNLS